MTCKTIFVLKMSSLNFNTTLLLLLLFVLNVFKIPGIRTQDIFKNVSAAKFQFLGGEFIPNLETGKNHGKAQKLVPDLPVKKLIPDLKGSKPLINITLRSGELAIISLVQIFLFALDVNLINCNIFHFQDAFDMKKLNFRDQITILPLFKQYLVRNICLMFVLNKE